MPTPTYYVFDAANNKYESLTKEQILAAITEAIETHQITDVDTGFVTTIKEQNRQTPLKFWIGTTAEYNAIANPPTDTFYILSDDKELEDIQATVDEVQAIVSNMADDVDDIEEDLETAEGNITTLQETVAEITTKNGQVLNTQNIVSGGVSIDLAGTYTIDQFSVVTVVASGVTVLCSVTSGESTAYIRGTMLKSYDEVIDVNLTCDIATNKITYNDSATNNIAAEAATAIDVSTITGVC